jgi:L-ascorbate metabolism protein UlaG (beta-lactamase superfamily)
MPSVLRQLPGLVRFLARRRERNRHDWDTARELNWRRRAGVDLPPGLTVQWLGTSGFRLAYEGHSVLIDPYVSRAPASAMLRPAAVLPSRACIDRWLPERCDAVLIGHTHFDHALDAPLIAERDGARVYGSRSMHNLMAMYGRPEAAVEVVPYQVYEIGPFEITFVPSVHSKLVLGLAIPASGDITCQHFDELFPGAYGCGQVWGIHIAVGGVTFYHQGSADLIDDAIRHRHVDYFLAGIAGRAFTDRYLERVVRKLEPRVVLAHHHDDFFRPLGEPMQFSFNIDVSGFAAEIARVSRDLEVCVLEPMQTAGASADPNLRS